MKTDARSKIVEELGKWGSRPTNTFASIVDDYDYTKQCAEGDAFFLDAYVNRRLCRFVPSSMMCV